MSELTIEQLKPARKPFQQGELDGYCGAYACINAALVIGRNLKKHTCQNFLAELFVDIAEGKTALPELQKFVIEGCATLPLDSVNKRYPINYSLPFRLKKHRPSNVKEYLEAMAKLLNHDPKNSAIISFDDYWGYSHWTVAYAVDRKTKSIMLFDSCGLKKIRQEQLLLDNDENKGIKRFYRIQLFYTYIISRA